MVAASLAAAAAAAVNRIFDELQDATAASASISAL